MDESAHGDFLDSSPKPEECVMAGGIDWFRWHHGSVTDPKFQLVAKRAGVTLPSVICVWAYVLEQASANSERGKFGSIDFESLDLLFGFEDGVTQRILACMQDRGLVSQGVVSAWEKRQPKREDETAAERKRRQRERENEPKISTPVTCDMSRDVTQSHADVTLGHDRGEESRKEKEKHFIKPLAADAAGFAEFWSAWPRKVGKAQAEKAWAKLHPSDDLVAAILRAIAAQSRSPQWLKDGGQFIPHPATWLNGKRWEDETDAKTQAPGLFAGVRVDNMEAA